MHLTRPYKKITLSFLAKELDLEVNEAEMMIGDMILEDRLFARIDQIRGIVEMDDSVESIDTQKTRALSKWADSIARFSENFYSKFS